MFIGLFQTLKTKRYVFRLVIGLQNFSSRKFSPFWNLWKNRKIKSSLESARGGHKLGCRGLPLAAATGLVGISCASRTPFSCGVFLMVEIFYYIFSRKVRPSYHANFLSFRFKLVSAVDLDCCDIPKSSEGQDLREGHQSLPQGIDATPSIY